LNELDLPVSTMPHRHAFLMVFWTTAGSGSHLINHHPYELSPGRLFVTLDGQVHHMLTYPEDGWLVLFEPALFRAFLTRHPEQEQHGLFGDFNRTPFVDLDAPTTTVFESLLRIMQNYTQKNFMDGSLTDLLSALLLKANQLYQPIFPITAHPAQVEQVRKLKILIEHNFKTERFATFYSDRLGIVTRKLNELTMKLTGKLIQDMVFDRLISEAEVLLGGTSFTIKEIAAELGFIHHSHFGFFFKKQKGITATEYRKRITSSYA
jgi:AraC family transcriptional activator of pobA